MTDNEINLWVRLQLVAFVERPAATTYQEGYRDALALFALKVLKWDADDATLQAVDKAVPLGKHRIAPELRINMLRGPVAPPAPPLQPIAVLAGTHNLYRIYVEQQPDPEHRRRYLWINTPDKAYGLEFADMVIVDPNYWNVHEQVLKDRHHIHRVVRERIRGWPQGQPPTPARAGDPMAELARLIGQEDPFANTNAFASDARRNPAAPFNFTVKTE